MEEYTDVFKALSDQTRLKIIWLLSHANTELCVCEIMDSLNESHYNISRHIKILKGARMVKGNKVGRWVYYHLSEPKDLFEKLIIQAISTIPHNFFSEDYKRLKKRLSLRKNGKCIVGMDS